jgi:hypothetical protein
LQDLVNRAFARDTHREFLQSFKVHCLILETDPAQGMGGAALDMANSFVFAEASTTRRRIVIRPGASRK